MDGRRTQAHFLLSSVGCFLQLNQGSLLCQPENFRAVLLVSQPCAVRLARSFGRTHSGAQAFRPTHHPNSVPSGHPPSRAAVKSARPASPPAWAELCAGSRAQSHINVRQLYLLCFSLIVECILALMFPMSLMSLVFLMLLVLLVLLIFH